MAHTLTSVSASRDPDAVTLRLGFASGMSRDAADLVQRSFIGDAVLRLAGAADLLGDAKQPWSRDEVTNALSTGGTLPAIVPGAVANACVVFAMRDAYMHGEVPGARLVDLPTSAASPTSER